MKKGEKIMSNRNYNKQTNPNRQKLKLLAEELKKIWAVL